MLHPSKTTITTLSPQSNRFLSLILRQKSWFLPPRRCLIPPIISWSDWLIITLKNKQSFLFPWSPPPTPPIFRRLTSLQCLGTTQFNPLRTIRQNSQIPQITRIVFTLRRVQTGCPHLICLQLSTIVLHVVILSRQAPRHQHQKYQVFEFSQKSGTLHQRKSVFLTKNSAKVVTHRANWLNGAQSERLPIKICLSLRSINSPYDYLADGRQEVRRHLSTDFWKHLLIPQITQEHKH